MKDIESNNIEFSFALEENPQEKKRKKKKKREAKKKGYSVFPAWVFCFSKFFVLAHCPSISLVLSGGLTVIQIRDNVMEIKPVQTYIIVGSFPLLPINPLQNGYM